MSLKYYVVNSANFALAQSLADIGRAVPYQTRVDIDDQSRGVYKIDDANLTQEFIDLALQGYEAEKNTGETFSLEAFREDILDTATWVDPVSEGGEI